jgi:hypothetical protein
MSEQPPVVLTLVSADGKEFSVPEEDAMGSKRLQVYFDDEAGGEFQDKKEMRCSLPFPAEVLEVVVRVRIVLFGLYINFIIKLPIVFFV